MKMVNDALSDDAKNVLQNKATEPPFSGALLSEHRPGVFACANCGQVLFDSNHKFESGSGWPSFYDLAKVGAVKLVDDSTLGMERTEVVCGKCDGHLGHLFEDAYNTPTGKRYCINSLALNFREKQ